MTTDQKATGSSPVGRTTQNPLQISRFSTIHADFSLFSIFAAFPNLPHVFHLAHNFSCCHAIKTLSKIYSTTPLTGYSRRAIILPMSNYGGSTLKCNRCKHEWRCKFDVLPKVCCGCGSPYWNKQRRQTPAKYTTVYIYALVDPITDDIRYIGRTFTPDLRDIQHRSAPHSERLAEWISDLKLLGMSPRMVIIDNSSRDCHDIDLYEYEWIQAMRQRGEPLLNNKAPRT